MNLNEQQKQVEAVLFAVGKEITSERISMLCSLKIKEVEKIMKKLVDVYSKTDNSLKIIQKENHLRL